jgi:cytidylate kinase
MPRVVTIDGPAGAGKSTVARLLADRLGWRFLDTGAMYRAVTLAALREGTDLNDDEELGELAARLEVRFDRDQVRLGEEDITKSIRSSEVTDSSQFVANCPAVRNLLVGWQRDFAADVDTVTEGRDQGTVVFPEAPCKFFVVADEMERARRRLRDLLERGESTTLEAVLEDQRARDRRDLERSIAPMIPAADAEVVDTTGKTIEEVVEELARKVLVGIE